MEYLRNKLYLILCLHLAISTLGAQEGEDTFRHHRLSLIMTNNHVPKGTGVDGALKWLVLGGWGLDYDYHFNERWAVSFQSDIILGDFVVREFAASNEVLVERAYPLAMVLAGLYSLTDHFTLIAGGGLELAPEENLGVLRIGLDHEWEFTDLWGVSLNLIYDLKLEVYDTWSFGVGINRRF